MTQCPCASGKPFADCCEPFLNGAAAPTAEALMRSRYSAFATQALPYLKETLAPDSREDFDEESVRQWASSAQWTGLEVVSAQGGGEGDADGKVHFVARYSIQGKPMEFEEKADFQKIDGRWYYVDGEVRGQSTYRREAPKVGRNDPCPCGSGKKYKKCCG